MAARALVACLQRQVQQLAETKRCAGRWQRVACLATIELHACNAVRACIYAFIHAAYLPTLLAPPRNGCSAHCGSPEPATRCTTQTTASAAPLLFAQPSKRFRVAIAVA
jgi:hypothetical protein